MTQSADQQIEMQKRRETRQRMRQMFRDLPTERLEAEVVAMRQSDADRMERRGYLALVHYINRARVRAELFRRSREG